MSLKDLITSHKKYIWWPFTQMQLAKDPIFVEKGEGVYLYGKTSDGKSIQFIDAISSWWVSIYGHNYPEMKEAIKKQYDKLEHVIFASIDHYPAIELAEKLSEKTHHRLNRIYFSDDGSTAMEIAIKMAFQYFQNQGKRNKTKFFVLENGYHGDTFGAMSIGARSEFHQFFNPLLFDVIHIEMQYNSQEGLDNEQLAKSELEKNIENLRKNFEKYAGETCAIVVEPIVQGAGGMLMYHPFLLKEIRNLCDTYEIFMICDEVFTGAGRLGNYFAYEKAGIYPDIVALSKGLTAGYATFAVTLVCEKIYQGFLSNQRKYAFFHGHSMTGNPIGCAASLQSLKLYDELDIKNKVVNIEQWHRELLNHLKKNNKFITTSRTIGSISAMEIEIPQKLKETFSLEMIDSSIKKGALIRPLGNVIYIVPPYIIEKN